MIVHAFRHRRFRAPSPRRIAKGITGPAFACLMLAGQMDPATAAPAPPAPSALTMGGILGILDIFNNRDPLRNVQPNQVYKTKYGTITGAEYEQRVLEERVKAYEAAIRAGGGSQADSSTRRRARQVERDIRRDDGVATAAAGMLAGNWEERAAAETVLKAAEEEKSGWFRAPDSSRSTFKKGMSSYRTPAREENDTTGRDGLGTGYLSPASPAPSQPAVMVQSQPAAVPGSADRPMPSLATMNPTTPAWAPVAPVTLKAPPAVPGVEIPEVKRLGPPPSPASDAPVAPVGEPKTPENAKPKNGEEAEAIAPGSGHAEMSSKEKLRMAVFGEASNVAEP